MQTVPLQKLPELVEKLTDALGSSSSMTTADRVRCLRQRGQCHFRVGGLSYRVYGVKMLQGVWREDVAGCMA